jgi:thiamine pyrophosphate-dependent acetolactate synthase large subunit-like protein
VTAADVVADGLRRAGAARVFVADGADATLVGAIRGAGLPIIEVAHPASACVMAAVTGRLGDVPGVVVVTGDDGTVSGAVAAAMRDHAPVIIVASRAPVGAPAKAVAFAGAESAAHWVAHAAQAAMSEPPGCVWLTVAPDVATRAALPVATAARPVPDALDGAELDALAEQVGAAARPLLIAGRGCRARATAAWLRAFAEALPAPVLVTPAGRGALPDPHPLAFGLLRADSAILRRADLVLALGVDDVELETAAVTFAAPALRLGPVAALLEELAPRLRDRARADWDVAELDRIRRAQPPPAVAPALAALVTRLREATLAGTAAVFARALEAATPLWHAVQPGDVLVEDDAVAAGAAVALERPESAVLVFAPMHGATVAELTRAGVRVVAPSLSMLGPALDVILSSAEPRVILVPLPG